MACAGAHTFCFACAVGALRRSPVCPMCRGAVTSLTRENKIYLVQPLPDDDAHESVEEDDEARALANYDVAAEHGRAQRFYRNSARMLACTVDVFLIQGIGLPPEVAAQAMFESMAAFGFFSFLFWIVVTMLAPYGTICVYVVACWGEARVIWRHYRGRDAALSDAVVARSTYRTLIWAFVSLELFSYGAVTYCEDHRVVWFFQWCQWSARAVWVCAVYLGALVSQRCFALSMRWGAVPGRQRPSLRTSSGEEGEFTTRMRHLLSGLSPNN